MMDDIIKATGLQGKWLPPWQRLVTDADANVHADAVSSTSSGSGSDKDSSKATHPYERQITISFTGSPRRFNEYSTLMREALVQKCKEITTTTNNPKNCVHGSYDHNKMSNNELSRNSVFCLQPPGDMPSRKSVFDSILSGCIPVLFHPLTAKYMYEWHWGQDLWEDIAISFDSSEENKALIHGGTDGNENTPTPHFIQMLMDMYADTESKGYVDGVGNGLGSSSSSSIAKLTNAERVQHALAGGRKEIRRRQRRMAQVAFQMQYSMVEEYTDANTGASTTEVAIQINAVNGLPLLDAYDVAMNRVLAIHAGRETHDRTSHYVQCEVLKGRQELQTADWCVPTGSLVDPYPKVSAFSNYLYKGK